MREIRLLDTSSYNNFLWMDASTFEELLSSIAPRITYQDTVMRQAISPAERLAVTLRFLATGKCDLLHIKFSNALFIVIARVYAHNNSLLYVSTSGETFESLQYLYRIPSQTIGQIVPDTCHAIVAVLLDKYMKVSQIIIIIHVDDSTAISKEF